MQVTQTQWDTINKWFNKIDSMTYDEIVEFERKWFMAKSELDAFVFNMVLRGIDTVKQHILKAQQSAMAVSSELTMGDI